MGSFPSQLSSSKAGQDQQDDFDQPFPAIRSSGCLHGTSWHSQDCPRCPTGRGCREPVLVVRSQPGWLWLLPGAGHQGLVCRECLNQGSKGVLPKLAHVGRQVECLFYICICCTIYIIQTS